MCLCVERALRLRREGSIGRFGWNVKEERGDIRQCDLEGAA
jgi:hypothetical protein